METKLSLKALFESNQEKLAEKLSQFVLPKDAVNVQNTVQQYLNELFDSDGEFRQNLTTSEDYILQAAMSLLNAQQAMVSEFSTTSSISSTKAPDSKVNGKANTAQNTGLGKELFPHTIGATAIGGAVGGLVLGTWGAFFGSIAGTALVLYYATTQQEKPVQKVAQIEKATEIQTQKLDVKKFISIISNICESVDTLIATFRSQINRVVDKYENQPKPTLENNFVAVLEGLQSLVGYKRTHDVTEDKYIPKLQQRIEDLVELLDNYDLEVVDYNENNKSLFEQTESNNVKEPKMVYPAIVKKGEIVRMGKMFVPVK